MADQFTAAVKALCEKLIDKIDTDRPKSRDLYTESIVLLALIDAKEAVEAEGMPMCEDENESKT